MKDIKKIMVGQLQKVTIIVIIIIAIASTILQMTIDKKNAVNQSKSYFELIEQLILENDSEAKSIEESFGKRQISAAEIVANLLDINPEKKEDTLWLKDLAYLVNVDEILFFDEQGVFIGGTHNKYQGLTFDEGEQISYFRPMLKSKFLNLSQDEMPRSIDGKSFRYAASWSIDKSFIIMVGTEGNKFEQITERFELSYILTMLKANSSLLLYATDDTGNNIIASTGKSDIGKNMEDLGYETDKVRGEIPYYSKIHDKYYISVSTKITDKYLICSTPVNEVYRDIIPGIMEIGLLLCIIAYIMISAVVKYVDRLVIRNIRKVNQNMESIANGNFDIAMDINNSFEFNELSTYINEMVTHLKAKSQEREQIFSIVSQHSNKTLYRYDLKEGRTYPWDAENAKNDVLSHLYQNEYSESSVINNEYILPESFEDVKQFFVGIHSGKPNGETKIHLKQLTGEARWYHFKYTTLFEGKFPHSALISIQDITEQHEFEIAYSRQVQAMEGDIQEHLLVIESNLTEDSIDKIYGQLAEKLEEIKGRNHNDIGQFLRTNVFATIDSEIGRKLYDINSLRELYLTGIREYSNEVQVEFHGGKEGWVIIKIQIIEDPYNKHLKAFTYIQDVTEEKEKQNMIRKKAEIDAMTGLLRKSIGQMYVEEELAKEKEYGGILITLDLDDLKGINDNLGHDEGDKAIIGIANILRTHFRKDDILVRNGGDEFMVFLPGSAKSVKAVEQSMSSLLKKLSEIYIGKNEERTIHCSAGCAVEIFGVDNFDSLFKKADLALYHVKRNGKNNFAFYEPAMEQEDYEFRTMKLMAIEERNRMDQHDMENMVAMIIKVYRVVIMFNLSENTYTILKAKDYQRLEEMPKKGIIEDFVKEAAHYVEDYELPLFYKTISRDYLLKKYHEGSESLLFKLRVKGKHSSQLMKNSILFYKNEKGDECAFNLLSK